MNDDEPETKAVTAGQTRVSWHDERMKTSFANVVNIQSTQEQIDLFFGTNQTWSAGSDESVKVDLDNRIIMTPVAAKRMWMALGGVLREYEARFGEMKIGGPIE
jgi:hypothetical protein